MRRFRRYLESIACLDHARRLTLHRQFETAFQDVIGISIFLSLAAMLLHVLK